MESILLIDFQSIEQITRANAAVIPVLITIPIP